MKKRILIPLDGSPFAERILAHLSTFGPSKNLDLILANVLESSRYYATFGSESLLTYDLSYWRSQAKEYLKMKAGELREMGHTVRTRLLKGDVAAALSDLAQAESVDLIAMTTHGRSGINRWVMGSVAERVLRSSSLPVFLVRPGADVIHSGAKTFLVPLDGSKLAESALDPVVELATRHDRVLLLSAVEHPEYWVEASTDLHVPPAAGTVEQQEKLAADYLENVASRLAAQNLTSEILVLYGPPADSIVDVAAQEGVALIVMTTHGRTGLDRWVFGSVAVKILRGAECPVLVVPTRAEKSAPELPAATAIPAPV